MTSSVILPSCYTENEFWKKIPSQDYKKTITNERKKKCRTNSKQPSYLTRPFFRFQARGKTTLVKCFEISFRDATPALVFEEFKRLFLVCDVTTMNGRLLNDDRFFNSQSMTLDFRQRRIGKNIIEEEKNNICFMSFS